MQCDICLEVKTKFYTLHNGIHPVCDICFQKIKDQENIICPFCRKKIHFFIHVGKITYI